MWSKEWSFHEDVKMDWNEVSYEFDVSNCQKNVFQEII